MKLTNFQEFKRAYICDDSDVDWFAVSASAGQRIFGYLSSMPADYELELRDATLTLLASSTNSGTTDEEILHTASADGTYYLIVWGYQGAHDASDPYTIFFRTVEPSGGPDPGPGPGPTAVPPACGEPFEPNDSRAEAYPLSPGTGLTGFVCDAHDTDWFRVTLDVGDVLDARLDVPADFDLKLRDGLGDVIARSAGTATASEWITHTATVYGDLYLHVYGYGGAHDATSPYTLNATITRASRGCNEWFEPNESQSAAAALSSGVGQQGLICDAQDQDWFDVPVSFGERLMVELTRLPADFDLQVFDPSGALLAGSANGGTADERVELVASDAGRFAIQVFGYQQVADPVNPYLVEAIVSAPGATVLPTAAPPTATATFTATPWPTMTPTPRPKPTQTATPTATTKPTRTPEPPPTVAPKPTSTGAPPTATALPPTVTPSPTTAATRPPKPTATTAPTIAPTATAPPKPTSTATVPASTATASPTQSPPEGTAIAPPPTAMPSETPPIEPTTAAPATATPLSTPVASATTPSGEPTWTPAPPSPTADLRERPTIYLPYGLQFRRSP